jgi:hypothetical protein
VRGGSAMGQVTGDEEPSSDGGVEGGDCDGVADAMLMGRPKLESVRLCARDSINRSTINHHATGDGRRARQQARDEFATVTRAIRVPRININIGRHHVAITGCRGRRARRGSGGRSAAFGSVQGKQSRRHRGTRDLARVMVWYGMKI